MAIAERELSAEMLAIEELEHAAHYLDLEPWIVMRLRQPEREIHLNLQVRRESGETAMLRASRVHHSTSRGPTLGPLLVSNSIGMADVRAEALKLTLQYALWGLPFCGSVGHIPVDFNEWSEKDLRNIVCSYTEALSGSEKADVIAASRDLPPQMITWMFSRLPGDHEHLSRFTGKPVSMGGIDREYVAARFMATLVRSVAGRNLLGLQIAMLGFDSLAQRTAAEFEAAGAKVIAICDCSGAVYHESGLNIETLRQHVAREDVVFGFPEAESQTLEKMIRTPCDVLILADSHDLQIRPAAKIIVEAGGSTAPELGCEAAVIPSMLADFGLSFADFLEWRKAKYGFCSDREIMRGMQGQIRRTWQEVSDYAHKHNLSLRKAAQVMALSKVAEAMRMK
ncbi:MAG TPA: Glu/Leu/Phe/Val dehydrogenase dimerization domain-containing protein [Terriglobales bacterium]|nr:Glu/Leu/Phe/Val dehydrogenase dimerization domain-containing protein [Terriglobales bacterium]